LHEYSNREKYPDSLPVDGYVLLATVSDREMAGLFIPPEVLEGSLKATKKLIDAGRAQDVMPKGSIPEIFQSPLTAYRWWSLAAEG
jgi:hypothetical protein